MNARKFFHRRMVAVAAFSAWSSGGTLALAQGAKELADAPVNRWVRVESSDTGGRHSPMFFYEPRIQSLVLSGGMLGGNYHQAKRHFDTEHLDPKTWAWTNAYPPALPQANASGVTGASAPHADWKEPLWNDGGILRITVNGQGPDTRAHFQWCYDADAGKLFACLGNKTLRYDAVSRAWEDTGAVPFSKGKFPMVWGSMCYDPVNRQVLCVGGSSDEPGGTPGVWAYHIADNAWVKVEAGSPAILTLRQHCLGVRRQAAALLAACRGRFFIAENAAEAQSLLSEQAVRVVNSIHQLSKELAASILEGHEADQGRQATAALDRSAAALEALAPSLNRPLTPQTLAELKSAVEPLEWAFDDLAVQPSARAGSQMAYDASSRKIVLFGGNELDRCRADTWVYDCPGRAWRRASPKISPAPRAGHCLTFLPKSRKLAMAGGYTLSEGWFKALPPELWSYDVAADEWKLLTTWDSAERSGQGTAAPATGPRVYVGGNYSGAGSPCIGAATPDDLLVMVDTGGEGRTTWACKVDPSKTDDEGTRQRGVADGANAVAYSKGPEAWEKDARPDPLPVDEFYRKLPTNTWTALPKSNFPTHRCWNSTAFDPDRRQFLYWGGGHVTAMATDVAHYSLRANLWTTSYPPDLPLEPSGGFNVKAALTFHDRPQIPVHAYQAYAYDPLSGLMLYLDRGYDVAAREWDAQRFSVPHGGVMHTLMETTPSGAVLWSEAGLFRFDARARGYKKLPYEGPKLEIPWCDGHALCYDSKRDCLWLAPGKQVFQYTFSDGTCRKTADQPPKALGEFALWREQVYVPGADLILLMDLFKAPDGRFTHVVFDPAATKWYWIQLPFMVDGNPITFDHDISPWDSALHYDAASQAVLMNWGDHHFGNRVLALRLDRTTAKMSEMKD